MKHKAEIAGALAGAGMFFAARGAAKVVGGVFKALVPGIESPETTPWKYRPHPSQLQYEHHEHTEEVFVQQTIQRQPNTRKNHDVVIDMGPVETYDPNDIHNLVKEQQYFRNLELQQQQAQRQEQRQEQRRQQERIRERARRDQMAAEGRPHYSDVLKAAEAKANRKEKVRREQGIIASWFTK